MSASDTTYGQYIWVRSTAVVSNYTGRDCY